MDEPRKLAVFAIKKGRNGSIWVRAGRATCNQDGSLNLQLDVLPLDGVLHVRESFERTQPQPTLPH